MKRLARHALAACLTLAATFSTHADELRNIKPGEPIPAFRLPTIDSSFVELASLKSNVVVVVYASAEQRSSELALADSQTVLKDFASDPVKLVHITADAINKDYFQKYRTEHHVDAPLAFDADRTLYHQLGMIVFPTTIVIDKDGKLAHVISLRGPDYTRTLDAYIRHALGSITAEQMQDRLKATASHDNSPRSLASAHRAAARLMREKGRLDEARQELTKAHEQDPSDLESQLDLADINLALNQLDDADKIIDDLLKANPDHRRAKQLKGIALFRRGKLPEAEAQLLDALALNPDPARIHYYLGRIYQQQGDAAKAMQHYREALQHTLHEPDPADAASK